MSVIVSNTTSLEDIQGEDHQLHRHHHHPEEEHHDHQDLCSIVAYLCNIVVDKYEVYIFFYQY